MSACNERWVDVFITKSADDPTTRGLNNNDASTGTNYGYDDEFCCSVQSIEFDPDDNTSTAYITTKNSEWILPTWSHASRYGSAAAATSPYADLKVGDLVRIGGIPQSGFTDYLTIVEIRKVIYLANGTAGAVTFADNVDSSAQTNIKADGTGHKFAAPSATSVPGTTRDPGTANETNDRLTLSTIGIARIAIRVNASLNCTQLPEDALRRSTQEVVHRQDVSGYSNRFATLEFRNEAYEYMSTNRAAYAAETPSTENFYYPLYRAKNWAHGKELVARLDHGVKQVAAVKLLGYSLVNKRQVGVQHAHEMQADDYLIMRIKEIDGHVISNNHYADGAFAILRAGDTSNMIVGAAEFSSYEPNGIVCVPVHTSHSTVRNLTIEITDRLGAPAHFGRLHLWFKLLVTHG
jgi:hypothetical protein